MMMRSIVLLSSLLVACCGDHDGCDAHPRAGGRDQRGPGRDHHDHDHDHDQDRDRDDDREERCVVLDRADGGGGAEAGDAATAVADAAPPSLDAGVSGGCRLDRDCAAAGAGLVCEVRSGACVTPSQCTTDAGCATGERCLAGRCLGGTAVCQFATDCGAGRDCVDGRCLAPCSARTACPSTQACVGGYCDQATQAGSGGARSADCASGSVCADGRCVAGCDASRPCATAEVCVLGVCPVDTSPRTFCVRDADCATGSVCRRGSCRAACPGGTTAECLRVDVAFDTCGADLLCTNPLELRPECARSVDCAAPTVCINARCR